MSAEWMVLPKVWGCAEAGVFEAGVRKGPVRVEAGPGLKPSGLVGGGRGAAGPRFHREGEGEPRRLKPHLVGSVDGTAEAVPLSKAGPVRAGGTRRQRHGEGEARSAGSGRLHLVRAAAAGTAVPLALLRDDNNKARSRSGADRYGMTPKDYSQSDTAVDPTMAADGPIALRRQEALAAGGVGYEFYRKYTEAMLRRYMTMSFENGRVPSMLGRELFRGKASTFTINSFEDVSNFVHDMGRCLQLLDAGQRHLVRRIALEEYTLEETAAMLGMSLRTVARRYREAIDRLTRVLLEREMMQPLEAGGEERGVD